VKPPAFASPIAPGAVWIDGRIVEYALCSPAGSLLRVRILDVFKSGDERATIEFAPFSEEIAPEVAQHFVDATVYRRVISMLRGIEESAVEVPERVASFLLGITEDEVAQQNAEAMAIAEQLAGDGTRSLIEYRRTRRVSGPAAATRSRRSS
jgi:hypothetical protein